MTLPNHNSLSSEQRAELAAFQREHGLRVRRAEAMALLDIKTNLLFQKVVDANPGLAHRVPGEKQDKYVTAVIYALRPASRCVACGEGDKVPGARAQVSGDTPNHRP